MLRKAILLCLLAGAGAGAGMAGNGLAGEVAAIPVPPAPQAHAHQALVLPEPLRTALAARMPREPLPEAERVRRIVDFMVADDGLALRYLEQPTHGIDRSVQLRRVNCLSFTLLFVALVRASGLQARAQASDDAMAVRVHDGTVFRTSHVNAGVRIDGRWHSVDPALQEPFAARPPEAISDLQAVALLHNNNAVEQLVLGDTRRATAEIALALALDPANATAWSNAGVVAWRSGEPTAAADAYLHALRLQRDHVGALGNLAALYRDGGETRLAVRYERRLRRAQAQDPFSQFLLGQGRAASGAYAAAAAHFRRAIRLMPDQPAFHRDLAEAYEKQGRRDAAASARQRASQLEARREARRRLRLADDAASG